MGKPERQGQRSNGANILLILAAVLMLAVIGLAVYIIPRIGKTAADHRALSAELKKTEAALAEEQAKRDAKLEEKMQLEAEDEEIKALRAETFELAAKLEKQIKAGKSDSRICYLTIDDGPYYRGKKLLAILQKYDVKATFFLTTANGDKLPDKGELSAKSMYPEYLRYGHTIGNHSYSHKYGENGIYKSTQAFMKDIEKQQEFTEEATGGYTPRIVRMPGGRATAGKNLEDIEKALSKEGYGWIDWTVDSGDSWGKDEASPELIMKQVKNAAKDQKIMVLLCHEWSKDTEEALPEVIQYLEGKGYIFLPLFYESRMVYK